MMKSLLHQIAKPQPQSIRTGLNVEDIKQAFIDNLFYIQGKHPARATLNDLYMALSYSVRDRLLHRCLNTIDTLIKSDAKVVCFFSAEYLLGPLLEHNILNLDIYNTVKEALNFYGINLETILDQEAEPGLGNGGLGRLAACYMDSLSTLEIPTLGYGIHYEFGLFKQTILDGWQQEQSDKWLSLGNPWEIIRPEASVEVKFGGYTQSFKDSQGKYQVQWTPSRIVKGIAYDTPILGYKVNTCNMLRLWAAEAIDSFDFGAFNMGNYIQAVHDKINSETITKVLYPNDQPIQGKLLRLEQQYFFVSCSLQDMIRLHISRKKSLHTFHETYAVQLNDTHPSIAVAELMRLLVDVHQFDWDSAWTITTKTFAFTNHTLLPEALEKWPIDLFSSLLPRHLEIIYEINWRFLEEVKKRFPGDSNRIVRMSLIDETGARYLRMAYLACIGSYSVNGVAKLHTQLLKEHLFKDFVDMWPEKFSNKTNGISPRRFLLQSDPELSELISEKIGKKWLTNLDELHQLESFANDQDFLKAWHHIKMNNKQKFAACIKERTGIIVNTYSLFDVQAKRIHEYKRQHLNILHILTLYHRLRVNPNITVHPRTFIFAGKAAPGYYMAKLIIKLINSIAEVINHDPVVNDRIKVVFFPNFNVKNAQKIYPAADLSEQISTAGMEASGTGNMKFALNGALTIGTLDGANIEIRDEVGKENFFLFGLTAQQVEDMKKKGYVPRTYYEKNQQLRDVIDMISSGLFSPNCKDLFKPLVDSLLNDDRFMVLADYDSYIQCQEQVSQAYLNLANWDKMSVLNTARMGKFSSDRAIKEYSKEIWKTKSVPIKDRELHIPNGNSNHK